MKNLCMLKCTKKILQNLLRYKDCIPLYFCYQVEKFNISDEFSLMNVFVNISKCI